MANNKVCDFCLDEPKGLFHKPEKLSDGHYICKKCRATIEKYKLPVKHDVFQLLVTADANMRDVVMMNYLDRHTPSEVIAKFYPLPKVLLHDGERAINVYDATITVDATLIPETLATTTIADITRKDFTNLESTTKKENATKVSGKLYETDAALYFLSEHFINCHRLTNMVRDNKDGDVIYVDEKGKNYRYAIEHVDLFYMREDLFFKVANAQEKRDTNLIYLSSENTMTLTPGVYTVPRNITPGTYYVSPIKDDGLNVRDAVGRIRECRSGKIHLDQGSTLEVTGEYQFRIQEHDDNKK